MKANNIIFLVLLGFYLAVASFLTVKISEHAKGFKTEREDYVEVLKFQDRLLSWKEWIFTDSEWSKKQIVSNEQLRKSDIHYEEAKKYAYYVAVLSIVFFALVLALYWGKLELAKMLGIAMLVIAIVCLILGIYIPMLEIAAYSEDLTIPIKIETPLEWGMLGGIDVYDTNKVFEGRTYYYYQSKSVLELISILFKNGNAVVAICILCFSVVIPVVKTFFSILTLLVKPFRRRTFVIIIEKIGKWSMADVFVVAIFLAFLSFYNLNTGLETESQTLVGLYFFLAYYLVSMASTYLIKAALRAEGQ